MPRYSSYPVLLDEVLTIKMKDLKTSGLLLDNKIINSTIKWTSNYGSKSEIQIIVNNKINKITLNYSVSGVPINYDVTFQKRTSNLGKGFVYYFLCPFTNSFCRNLYLVGYYFSHRKAEKSTMYSCQVKSKTERIFKKYFDNAIKIETLLDEINGNNFKRYYNNKPTKRFVKVCKELKNLGYK